MTSVDRLLSAPKGSLAWRLIVPVPITIAIAVLLIWVTVPQMVASIAINDAVVANQQFATEFKAIRAYYSENIVNKVVKGGTYKASHEHKANPYTIPIPATFVHELSAVLQGGDTTIALFSPYPFPGRKDRKLDSFQEQAWTYLNANPDAAFSRAETRNGRNIVRVAVADRMSGPSCVNCHNTDPQSPKTDWKLGDVRGALEVTSTIDAQLANGATLSHWMVGGALLIGVILAAITLLVARSITKPLRGMVRDMGRLASSDFQVVLPEVGRNDEIGAMAAAVERFKIKAMENARLEAEHEEAGKRVAAAQRRGEIQELADGFESMVGKIVTAVASLTGEVEQAAGTLTNNAEITRQVSDVVVGASEEASATVQSVAHATQALTTSVAEISNRARESNEIASHAVRQAQETDGRIAELATAADRIGNVLKLITGIAAQTNLLALNATIEAARAGEAGRGFAVVASEVKTLATQTAKATDDIANQIAQMQSATRDSVSAIKDIGATIGRISDIATAIANAVELQSRATDDIAAHVDHAAVSTTRVAASIGDVHRRASETSTASNRVLASARTLAAEGGTFKLALEKFLANVRAA